MCPSRSDDSACHMYIQYQYFPDSRLFLVVIIRQLRSGFPHLFHPSLKINNKTIYVSVHNISVIDWLARYIKLYVFNQDERLNTVNRCTKK